MERNINVLIANENTDESNEISEKLTNEKNLGTIDKTSSGKEAVSLLQNKKYDLLVVDLVLSEVDGFEVIEKAKQTNKSIKIVVLSALSSETFIKKTMSLGANYYMLKPINMDVLAKRIDDLFNEEQQDKILISKADSEKEIEEKTELIKAEFDMPNPISDPVTVKLTDEDLYQAARTAAALDRLVEKFKLTGLAYYYEGREDTIQRLVASSFIAGNSILNAEGIPMCGEYDIKTCIAMLIMDRLDIGGSFAEFHPFGFKDNYILVGHDGPHHMRIAEGKPVLRSLLKYHGKPGHGASVEFKLKEGPITMLGITQKGDGSFKFVIGEGTSQEGAIPPTGNTNTRGVFEPDTRNFIKRWVMEGPTHHYALGIGHHADTIKKIADILGIEAVIVR